MYGCRNVKTKVHIVHADRNTPGFMRSPPEVPYIFALESAMDELAVKLDMDPVELRRVNDTMNEPINGKPYTSRSLMQCFDQAAEAFGWSKRNPQAGLDARRRLADRLGLRHRRLSDPYRRRDRARALTPDGRRRVQIAAHEIGTGAYTVVGPDGGRAARRAARRGVRSSWATATCRRRRSPAARTRPRASARP